jgi:hypothetical protein
VSSLSHLLEIGAANGAASLGLEAWPEIHVDLDDPALYGVEPADVPAALVFSCAADVFAG